MAEREKADIVIVGCGPAGCAAAIRLIAAGARVIICDSKPGNPARWPHSPGEKCAADTANVLSALGVAIEEFSMPCSAEHIRWARPQAETRISGSGLLMRRNTLDDALTERARECGASMRFEHSLRRIEGGPGSWQLGFSRAGTRASVRIAAPFVIDATGRQAALARRMGIAMRRADTLVAIADYRPPGTPRSTGRFALEAQEAGWWYGVDLPDGGAACCYLTMWQSFHGPKEQVFAAAFERASTMPNYFQPDLAVEKTFFAAAPGRLERVAGPGWAAIGDAALHSDPIAGTGIYRALLTGMRIAAVLGGPVEAMKAERIAYEQWVADAYDDHLTERGQVYRDSTLLGERFLSLLNRFAERSADEQRAPV